MAELENLGGVTENEIIVIPIIDVSGSMCGERIGQVNEAMAEVPAQLADINENSIDAKLLIAPMEFSSGARWFSLKNNQPAEVESFRWIDMKANGLTDLGAAFKLLNEKLTSVKKGGWMNEHGGLAPVLILISDGGPTDDYQTQLNALKNRAWFKAATKFAVAVEGADESVLAEFTGNSEAVIDTTVIRNDLASIVKAVVVSASKAASQSASGAGSESKYNTVMESNADEVNDRAQDLANAAVNTALINLNNASELF